MIKIEKSVKKTIEKIKKEYGNSNDLNTRIIKIEKTNIGILFMESSSSTTTISDFIVKSIDNIKNEKKIFENLFDTIKNNIYNSQILTTDNFNDFSYYLSSGFTIIIIDSIEKAIILETRADLDRGVSEATNEPVLRGPKDSFTESHAKNLGLIRKRIKDSNLWFEEVKIGKRTKTRVNIAYINDIVKKSDIEKIKNRLNKINIDGILDSGTLKEYLNKEKSSFPIIQSTERPDLASISLLNGKIIILVENSPYVLILPSVFSDFLHTSEDEFQNSTNISFTRILKVAALLITLFTPAIYIAITTFNQAVVPNKLLISLAIQREGVPFPTAFEVILLMMIFEILRESDIRLPANMGASMSIVGALVLGEAAVNAGIVSPIAVIVVAITSICSLIFTDADFINGIRAWRLIFIISATFLGLIGLLSASLCFVLKLSSLESLNVSYLSPISPLSKKDVKEALLKNKMSKTFKRPSYLNINNRTKQGGN
ncbi:MAG: spore germination protein [Bacilli bacterium]|nr:spore germination protein [Bacilli bacterium]